MIKDRENILKGLNEKQLEAVECINGPLLVLAGAGSGKTSVITHRIAYLINAGVSPFNILAITFTNKAAGEMRERVMRKLSLDEGANVWVSTFHSMCVRLLRRDIDKLGYTRDFTIYDTDDQKTLMRGCIKSLNLDNKIYRGKAILSIISKLKNASISPEQFEDEAKDFYDRNVARAYEEYDKELKKNNALDFDDLLLKTAKLLKDNNEVLSYWQNRFRYILIDEYQDTNDVQFELVRMLSQKYKNICAVGDDDQSIYKFRGANIENILNFEKNFPGTKVVKLEQNYRSTSFILNVANEVIKNNGGRKDKRLWTKNNSGALPEYREYKTASDEARNTIRQVLKAAKEGTALRDQAVLYRTNVQSRLLEESCVEENIPYVIVGGVNFYQRKEIKDMLCYLRGIANDTDDQAFLRIINVPKRGLGESSVNKVNSYAFSRGISFSHALLNAKNIPGLTKSAIKRIEDFSGKILEYRTLLGENKINISQLIDLLMAEPGYIDELKKDDTVSFETRMENLEELKNRAISFETERADMISSLDTANINEGFEEPTELLQDEEENGLDLLSAFVEDISLVSDIDRTNDNENALTLMTLHAAKGLEFDTVYMCGMEEGLFPSAASINSDDPISEIEEERRLCYVGMTRAKKRLIMSSARERMVNGEMCLSKESRFIDEIPEDLAYKHFLRKSQAEESEPFFNFGGYEGKMESELLSEDTFSEKKAYSAYNSFNKRVYGNYGSLDHDSKKSSRLKERENVLNKIQGIKKGLLMMPGKGVVNGTGKAFLSKKKPEYQVGDRVFHIKFGQGTVTEIVDTPRDFKVSVKFDDFGIKVMYAAFARLKKC